MTIFYFRGYSEAAACICRFIDRKDRRFHLEPSFVIKQAKPVKLVAICVQYKTIVACEFYRAIALLLSYKGDTQMTYGELLDSLHY